MQDLFIVGGGVSTYYLLFLFSNLKLNSDWNITVFNKEDVFPSVPKDIYPIISLNGIEKGNSDLGDLLYESYGYFKDFQKNVYNFSIELDQHFLYPNFSIDNDDFNLRESRFIRRHGNSSLINKPYGSFNGKSSHSFFVRPRDFYQTVVKMVKNNPKINLEFKNELILNVEEGDGIYTLVNEFDFKYQTRFLFMMQGAGSAFLNMNFLESTKLAKHKLSCGKIFVGNIDLGADSFILTYDKLNFLYDSKYQRCQFGQREFNIRSGNNLEQTLEFWSIIFGHNLSISNIKEFRGFRDKGHRRRPSIFKKIDRDSCYVKLSGLYKNAWTISLRELHLNIFSDLKYL